MEMITSAQNSKVKNANKLKKKRIETKQVKPLSKAITLSKKLIKVS